MSSKILLEAGTNELEIIEFYIDQVCSEDREPERHYYGINVAKVLEIIRLPSITRFPGSRHASILGTFNLRSRIIPLIDLSTWLGTPAHRHPGSKVIVSEFNSITNAFLVSGVNRIHRIGWGEIDPPSGLMSEYAESSITGVVRIEGKLILILDLEKMVSELNPRLDMRIDKTSLDRIRLGTSSSGSAYKALIADDSGVIRKQMATILRDAGFEVTETVNGKEAWDRLEEMLSRSAECPGGLADLVSVVVTDIEMPAMDGHTLTKKIKTHPELRQLPVILFSSLITDRLRHKGESVGADEQIAKPELTRLAEMAKGLIEGRRMG